MAVKGPPPEVDGIESSEAAGKALMYSIIGIFCFGIVLGPIAMSKAIQAKREIREDPRLGGLAKANIGLLLGAAVVILWIIGMASKLKR